VEVIKTKEKVDGIEWGKFAGRCWALVSVWAEAMGGRRAFSMESDNSN
jgi:hypothetical protein